jgi:dTDP-4-amino-4,6-dideoxygalactose transaminase
VARIYLSPPHVGQTERDLLLDAFDSNWIAPLGPHVDALEREIASRAGVAHAAALSSGTAALHLALQLTGVGAGDEVMVSSLTFAATANPVAYVGATPVFVDCDPSDWQLDPDLLADELGRRAAAGRLPAAVVVADLYGQCADYDRITPLCEEYGVVLLEDAAEALGASLRGRAAGSFGAAAVFSFNGNKIITTSGGGMLVSDSAELIGRARFLATQARDPAPHYQHSEIGYNYRLSNLLAAIGRGQLQNLDSRMAARREVNRRYRYALGDVDGITFMPIVDPGWNGWLTCILVDPVATGTDREQLRRQLESLDIESRPIWKPLHLQPVFSGCQVIGGKAAETIFENGLCLPSGSSLTEDDQGRVIDAVRREMGR